MARLDEDLPDAARHGAFDGRCAPRQPGVDIDIALSFGCGSAYVLAGRLPARSLGVESRLLPRLESSDALGVGVEEGEIVLEPEPPRDDFDPALALRKSVAERSELLGRDRIELDPVEETQQPPLVVRELIGHTIGVPHLAGTAEQLVAARTLHAVDAEIGAADADHVVRRPGARGIVFRGDQPVARVDRHGDRRAEIDVAQAKHQIGRLEHDALYLLDRVEAVDAANELDVGRTPGRVGAHAAQIFVDGGLDRGVVP